MLLSSLFQAAPSGGYVGSWKRDDNYRAASKGASIIETIYGKKLPCLHTEQLRECVIARVNQADGKRADKGLRGLARCTGLGIAQHHIQCRTGLCSQKVPASR